MNSQFIITSYSERAMAQAEYDKLEDSGFAGRIPACKEVIAFGSTLRDCEAELQATLEDWLLVGFKLNHPLPVLDGINLNQEPTYEPLVAV